MIFIVTFRYKLGFDKQRGSEAHMVYVAFAPFELQMAARAA